MSKDNDTPQRSPMLRPPTPPKRAGKTPEAKVTDQINKYLEQIGAVEPINLRTGAGVARHGDRTITVGRKGTSDRTVCLPGGVFCAVECKATTAPTPEQRAYLDHVRALGGVAVAAYSVADLRAALLERFGAATVAQWEAEGKARAAAKRARRARR